MSKESVMPGYVIYCKIQNPSLQELYSTAIETHNNKLNQQRETHADSGFDLFTPEVTFNPMTLDSPIKIDHGVSMAMYYRDENNKQTPSAYYMYPRSSISKTPYRLANSVGIIDSGYRGNLMAKVDYVPQQNIAKQLKFIQQKLDHLSNKENEYTEFGENEELYNTQSHTSSQSQTTLKIEHGTRMFQVCAPDLSPIQEIYLVDNLDNTSRGAGGFGSTGEIGTKQ